MGTYSDFIEFIEGKYLDEFYFFEKCFSNEEIKKIDQLVENDRLVDGVVSGKIDKTYRSSKISWVPFSEKTRWLYEKIGLLVNMANEDMWNFSIVGMREPIQYGEYSASENGHYDWHMDIGGKTINRKISVTVQLSNHDEYEGGDLQFMLNKKVDTAPKGKGNVIIFPSYFLHRVTPVTKGFTYSFCYTCNKRNT